MGQLPAGAVQLIESVEEAESFAPKNPSRLAYTTQTTLSVADTREILSVLQRRFPQIAGPAKEDICYATTNRQEGVKQIAARCDALIVVGAPNSSNSQRLVETAQRAGCPHAFLVQRAEDIDFAALAQFKTIGITAGASAPEVLVQEVIEVLHDYFRVSVEAMTGEEKVTFKLPRQLKDADGQAQRPAP
jgi:4-hydroxy-3-methylbut-2-enyl diphosphate reductase